MVETMQFRDFMVLPNPCIMTGKQWPPVGVLPRSGQVLAPSQRVDGVNLLDSLLRCMKQSARRYPQEISQEGGLW